MIRSLALLVLILTACKAHAQEPTFDSVYSFPQDIYPVADYTEKNKLKKVSICTVAWGIENGDTIVHEDMMAIDLQFSTDYFFNSNGLLDSVCNRQEVGPDSVVSSPREIFVYDKWNRVVEHHNLYGNQTRYCFYVDSTSDRLSEYRYDINTYRGYIYYKYSGFTRQDSAITYYKQITESDTILTEAYRTVNSYNYPPAFNKEPTIYDYAGNVIVMKIDNLYHEGTSTYLFNNAGQLISITENFKQKRKHHYERKRKKQAFESVIEYFYNPHGTIRMQVAKGIRTDYIMAEERRYSYTY